MTMKKNGPHKPHAAHPHEAKPVPAKTELQDDPGPLAFGVIGGSISLGQRQGYGWVSTGDHISLGGY